MNEEDYLKQGEALERAHHDRDAVQLYQSALQFFPQSHALYARLGVLFLQRGELLPAAEYLERALRLDHAAFGSLSPQAEALTQEQTNRQRAELQNRWDVQEALALVYLQLNRPQNALDSLADLAHLEAHEPPLFKVLRAQAYEQLGQWPRAQRSYEQALASQPVPALAAEIYRALSLLQQRRGLREAAARARAQVFLLTLIAQHAAVSKHLQWIQTSPYAHLYDTLAPILAYYPPVQRAPILLYCSELSLKQNQVIHSYFYLRQGLGFKDVQAECLLTLGLTLKRTGQWELAQSCFLGVLTDGSTFPSAASERAAPPENIQAAEREWRKLLQMTPQAFCKYLGVATAPDPFVSVAAQATEDASPTSRSIEFQRLSKPQLKALSLLGEQPGRPAEQSYPLLKQVFHRSPTPELALSYLRICLELERFDEALLGIQSLNQGPLSPSYRRALLYLQGQILDRQGQYAQAFVAWQGANQFNPAPLDRERLRYLCESLQELFTPERFQSDFHRLRGHDSQGPIFIVGMPRSGTSLTEQILAAHPRVYGAGELYAFEEALNQKLLRRTPIETHALQDLLQQLSSEDLQRVAEDYLQALDSLPSEHSDRAEYVTDKMPGNFFHLGWIALVFPRARLIHCSRHPLDVSLSCFAMDFENVELGQNLDDLGAYYQQYQRLMRHWQRCFGERLIEVVYEDLVTQPEHTIRKLLEHCELEWDEACLHFAEQRRFVGSSSRQQMQRVQQGIDTRSMGRHQNYLKQLKPLEAWIDLSAY